MTLLPRRDQTALALLHQVCSWENPLSSAAGESSESSSVSKSSFPAEVWHSLCSWDLQGCCLLVTCSPEAEKAFCSCLCWAGLWEMWVCAPGVADSPRLKIARSLTKHLMPLPGSHPVARFILLKVLPSASPTPTPCWIKLTPIVFFCC